MIKSMTGFGRCEVSGEEKKLTVEMKSVNHKYFDANIRMPRKLAMYENQVRCQMKKYLERGKIDVFITVEDLGGGAGNLHYNEAMAETYLNCFQKMSERFHIENTVTTVDLARLPEIFTMEEPEEDQEKTKELLIQAVDGACRMMEEARAKEGERLRTDLLGKLEQLKKHVDFIEQRFPAVLEEYRSKLKQRVMEVLEQAELDESRIAAEVTMYTDRTCVDEELVRLRSHIQMVEDTLLSDGSMGKKLDFLAQEMNREANTILSKSGDLEITNTGIGLKTGIEKIREQIQNIE